MTLAQSGIEENEDGENTITVDLNVFSLQTIKKAAYRFGNECSFSFHQTSPTEIEVTINFGEGADKNAITHSFLNELVDQDLRELIAQETAPTRNLILAHAFSKTGLQNKK